jgi:hypothetical protein
VLGIVRNPICPWAPATVIFIDQAIEISSER